MYALRGMTTARQRCDASTSAAPYQRARIRTVDPVLTAQESALAALARSQLKGVLSPLSSSAKLAWGIFGSSVVARWGGKKERGMSK